MGVSTSETASGVPVIHSAPTVPSNMPSDFAALLAHAGSYGLELDGSTFLPATLSYATHPDDNAAFDIPVKVTYSDYRTVDGTAIPFHIQRYLNGVLSLDITLSDATVAH